MASCPNIDVMNGVIVLFGVHRQRASFVNTLHRLRSCHWLQLRAANGLAIPYIGYLELDVILCGKKDPSLWDSGGEGPCER